MISQTFLVGAHFRTCPVCTDWQVEGPEERPVIEAALEHLATDCPLVPRRSPVVPGTRRNALGVAILSALNRSLERRDR